MPDEGQEALKCMEQALDLMVQAGWIQQIVRKPGTGTSVVWTDLGKDAIAALQISLNELGPDLNRDLWWAIGTIATMHRSRDPKLDEPGLGE
jgi:hypothetical protein